MIIRANTLGGVSRAYRRYYSLLADTFVELLGSANPRVVLEAGCGRGQLTFPLLEKLPKNSKMIAVDSSEGPYAGWLEQLETKVSRGTLARRVRIVRTEVGRMDGLDDHSVDAIVSNELICDLTETRDLKRALSEFFRILRPGGLMVHGEWSSWPENGSQSFMIEHWPSWTPDQLFSLFRREGFHDCHVSYFDTSIQFGYRPAREELRNWGASENLLRRYDTLLKRHGVRLPFEHLVRCRKDSPRGT